ncbi:carbon-nitrogen family hydrolase [Bacillaceae bacterium]
MADKLRVAIAQMNIAFGQPERNAEQVVRFVEEAARLKEKPDVIVFPELWNTGYDLTRLDAIADREGAETKRILGELARKHQISIVGGSIAEKTEQGVYNTSYVFDERGQLLSEYRKVHLFRLMEEEKYLLPGDRIAAYSLRGIPCSTVICYDIRFPEWIRTAVAGGAKILFVAAQWPHPRLSHWRQLLIARAIENQMFVVACNRVGQGGNDIFCGHSMIVDPWGEIVAEGLQKEELLTAEIDLTRVEEVRKGIPVFADRRPELYR